MELRRWRHLHRRAKNECASEIEFYSLLFLHRKDIAVYQKAIDQELVL